nr:hypothetical protein [Bacteroidota bacterium]
ADPQSAEKARIWEPRAMQARKYSADLTNYIEDLKTDLKKGADLRMKWNDVKKDSVEDYRMDNLDASTRLFETNGKGRELEARLQKYKEDMLHIGYPADSSIMKEFKATFPVNIVPPVGLDGTKKDFTQAFFHMTPTIAALTMLSKFQNNIKNAESEIVTYCHSQIGAVKVIYDQFAALVGQSSNYVMPGQEIQITAGVGAYSKAAQPQISINGAGQSLDADGRAVYKFNASGAGNHTVPVNVTYTKPDGTKESKSFSVQYTVGTPGGAAVMLDKMNVFYTGVENPVSISSGTGWDKTKVSMAGGTLISAVVFKNQQYARAELKNFDFDARFSVVSATVYFNGANFPSVQTATISGGNLGGISSLLAKCVPGTGVYFDNVKVQGPDGVVRSIPGPGFILY